MKSSGKAIIAVVMISLFISGCEGLQSFDMSSLKVQKPGASLKNVKFGDVSLNGATLLFDTEITNPYSVALPIANMDYSVATADKPFAAGTADIATTIPAKSSKVLSLPVKVGYLDLVNTFKGVKPGSKIPYNAKLGLSVDAPALGRIRLPIDKTGQLAVPSLSLNQ